MYLITYKHTDSDDIQHYHADDQIQAYSIIGEEIQ